MRVKFDSVLEENKTLFKQEHKLDGTAKRLREELEYVHAPAAINVMRDTC